MKITFWLSVGQTNWLSLGGMNIPDFGMANTDLATKLQNSEPSHLLWVLHYSNNINIYNSTAIKIICMMILCYPHNILLCYGLLSPFSR